jgi:hypothetical protein
MTKKNLPTLFDLDEFERWRDTWNGMPTFNQKDLTSFKSIIVHFATESDYREFGKLVGQKLTYKTRSIWYPEAEIGRMMDKLIVSDLPDLPPANPVYTDSDRPSVIPTAKDYEIVNEPDPDEPEEEEPGDNPTGDDFDELIKRGII